MDSFLLTAFKSVDFVELRNTFRVSAAYYAYLVWVCRFWQHTGPYLFHPLRPHTASPIFVHLPRQAWKTNAHKELQQSMLMAHYLIFEGSCFLTNHFLSLNTKWVKRETHDPEEWKKHRILYLHIFMISSTVSRWLVRSVPDSIFHVRNFWFIIWPFQNKKKEPQATANSSKVKWCGTYIYYWFDIYPTKQLMSRWLASMLYAFQSGRIVQSR